MRNTADIEEFKQELGEWIRRQVYGLDISKEGTVEIGSYHHGSLCAYNSVLSYQLGQRTVSDFKFVDPKKRMVWRNPPGHNFE